MGGDVAVTHLEETSEAAEMRAWRRSYQQCLSGNTQDVHRERESMGTRKSKSVKYALVLAERRRGYLTQYKYLDTFPFFYLVSMIPERLIPRFSICNPLE